MIRSSKHAVAVMTGATVALFTFICPTEGDAQGVRIPKTPLDRMQQHMTHDAARKEIILGAQAPEGAYPFQVSMISAMAKLGHEFESHLCGGTFISPTWILTAGHCVTQDGKAASPDSIEVYAGSQNFHNGDRIPVKSVHRHPGFVDDFLDNDVALLHLARAPRPSTRFEPIALIDPVDEASQSGPGALVTIIGWGMTERDSLSRTLQRTTVKIVDRAQCNRDILLKRTKELQEDLDQIESKFRIAKSRIAVVHEAIVSAIMGNAGPIVDDSMICAGGAEPNSTAELVQDACEGDSGGPLVAEAADGSAVQVGIVSWGEGCGIPAVHGVYTRLARFTEWVRTTAR